jgi:hypothetical protein
MVWDHEVGISKFPTETTLGHEPDGTAVGLHPSIDAVRFRDDPPFATLV